MMKRFIRSSGIGVISGMMFLTLLAFALLPLMNPVCSALGEEETRIASDYQLDDFLRFFGVRPETKHRDALERSIMVTSLSQTGMTEQDLFEAFPDYVSIREPLPNNESNWEEYVVYSLSDGSRLFIFIEKGKLTDVYRMAPLCSAEMFARIMPGITTPERVITIDENSAFNPFIEWGPVSFHCLDDGTFRQVTYRQCRLLMTRYVVKDIATIPQDACLNVFSDIHADDMPRGE